MSVGELRWRTGVWSDVGFSNALKAPQTIINNHTVIAHHMAPTIRTIIIIGISASAFQL